MEFESVSLRVEKVIAPGAVGTVNVRPLAPGRYEFFDDFHPNTRGALHGPVIAAGTSLILSTRVFVPESQCNIRANC